VSAGSSDFHISFSNPPSVFVENLPNRFITVYDAPVITDYAPVRFFPGSTITVTGLNFIPEEQSCAATLCSVAVNDCRIVDFSNIVMVTASSTPNGSCPATLRFSNPNTVVASSTMNVSGLPTIAQVTPRNVYSLSTVTIIGTKFSQEFQRCVRALVCGVAATKCDLLNDSEAVVVLGP
jgi:hypothetical protein